MVHTVDKNLLRARAKAARLSLSREEVKAKSEAIFDRLKAAFPPENYHTIHVFHSIERFNEVATGPFVQELIRDFPSVRLVSPVMDPARQVLRHIHVHPEIEMVKNGFGVPEPQANTEEIAAQDIDLVVVPMLSFDENGQRLGYGKGYYDKFLSGVRPDCLKVGVCFENGKSTEKLPAEAHDVPLDYVITETGIYAFGPKPEGEASV